MTMKGNTGLSELAVQLRSLQNKSKAQKLEIARLEKHIEILSDLQNVSVQDLQKALANACEAQAHNSLRLQIKQLQNQIKGQQEITTTSSSSTADVANYKTQVASLELQVGEMEELLQAKDQEVDRLYQLQAKKNQSSNGVNDIWKKRYESLQEQSKLEKSQQQARIWVLEEQQRDLQQQLSSLYAAFEVLQQEQDKEVQERQRLESCLQEADAQVAKNVNEEDKTQQTPQANSRRGQQQQGSNQLRQINSNPHEEAPSSAASDSQQQRLLELQSQHQLSLRQRQMDQSETQPSIRSQSVRQQTSMEEDEDWQRLIDFHEQQQQHEGLQQQMQEHTQQIATTSPPSLHRSQSQPSPFSQALNPNPQKAKKGLSLKNPFRRRSIADNRSSPQKRSLSTGGGGTPDRGASHHSIPSSTTPNSAISPPTTHPEQSPAFSLRSLEDRDSGILHDSSMHSGRAFDVSIDRSPLLEGPILVMAGKPKQWSDRIAAVYPGDGDACGYLTLKAAADPNRDGAQETIPQDKTYSLKPGSTKAKPFEDHEFGLILVISIKSSRKVQGKKQTKTTSIYLAAKSLADFQQWTTVFAASGVDTSGLR